MSKSLLNCFLLNSSHIKQSLNQQLPIANQFINSIPLIAIFDIFTLPFAMKEN